MSATIAKASIGDVRADLQELVGLAGAVAAAEAKLEAFAEKLFEREGDVFHDRLFEAGMNGNLSHVVQYQVKDAVTTAKNQTGSCDIFGLEKAQAAQDALDVFDFACRRDGLAGEDDGAH